MDRFLGKTGGRFLLLWGLSLLSFQASTRRIAINLGEISSREELRIEETGWSGELVLETDTYEVDESTDLLLHLDRPVLRDATGHYEVVTPVEHERKLSVRGLGAARLRGQGALVLRGGDEAFLTGERPLVDFTIELWAFPLLLEEGEELFLWEGAYRRQDGSLLFQRVEAAFFRRTLKWTFKNLFLPVETGEKLRTFDLEGPPLVPKKWTHHMVRYVGQRGRLEYLVDGVLRDVTHTTPSGKEDSVIYPPTVGKSEGKIIIGRGFTGLIDEVRITREGEISPSLARLRSRGEGITEVIDLGSAHARVVAIHGEDEQPHQTEIRYYYTVDEHRLSVREQGEVFLHSLGCAQEKKALLSAWRPFALGVPFEAPRGRYLMVGMLFSPDKARKISPRLKTLSVEYAPPRSPPPPQDVVVDMGLGEVSLRWRGDVNGASAGYLLYYGRASRSYGSPGSPIDVGLVEEYTLKEWREGGLYYFSLRAYDHSSPPLKSVFSKEVLARL